VIGQITRVISENELIVEIAEGIRVRVMRSMVSDMLAKSEPAVGEDEDKDDEGKDDETEGEQGDEEAEEKPRPKRRRRARKKAGN
jgi:preprotein translocase subunit YajC